MGHARSETFLKHYMSSSVIVDVQATFLGQDSKSDLIKEMGKLTLRRDPNLPKKLTNEQKAQAYNVPELIAACQQFALLRRDIQSQFGAMNKAPEGNLFIGEHNKLRQRINTMKLCFKREALEKLLRDYHTNADLQYMIAQLKGEKPISTPMLAPINYVLPERIELAHRLFQPADDFTFTLIVSTMVRLCGLHEDRYHDRFAETTNTAPKTSVFDPATDQISSDNTQQPPLGNAITESYGKLDISIDTSLKSCVADRQTKQRPELQEETPKPLSNQPKIRRDRTALVCLFCQEKGGRKQPFPRKDSLRRHYRTRHFQYQVGAFFCPVPGCGQLIKDPNHFCSHAVSIHKSDLGARASIMKARV